LLQAGVTRVVAAMSDPNPRVAGAGLAHLRAAGVVVRCGLLEVEARELNPGFISRMTRGLPWVRLKAAASLDGFTALTDGRSQWITGPQARADGHAWRARACAILTGIGTVREDDPQLTVRDVDGHPDGPPADWAGPARQPLRVVVDSRLEIDPGAKLVRGGDLLLVHAVDPQWLRVGPLAEKAQRLRDHGVELLALPASNPVGKVDLRALLDHLAQLEINELHVEAGARLNASFLREGCIDEMLIYLAPMLLGVGRGLFDALFKRTRKPMLNRQCPILFNLLNQCWREHCFLRGQSLRIPKRFCGECLDDDHVDALCVCAIEHRINNGTHF
jgi:diaminohydroxyphosphoribosylaminopyrimidine deaminase/5-amino-6-(5-phosphoribosylamino)uracil reductase